MANDACLKLDKKKGRRRLTFEALPAADGKPLFTYKVGGKMRPFNAEAASELGQCLQAITLACGINADSRVKHTYEQGGSRRVLELIDGIRSDYSKRVHCQEFLALDGLRDEEIRDLFELMADAIGSDYELASVLVFVAENYLARQGIGQAFHACIAAIASDYEKGRVLQAAFHRDGLTYDQVLRVLEALDSIDSDYEAARVLMAIDPHLLCDDAICRIYFEALTGINSDYEKAGVLTALARHARRDPKLRRVCLEAADCIRSDYEYSRVVRALR
jgi:hypothetical protein